MSHHDKRNRDVVLGHKKAPEGLHEIQGVRYVLKHHLMLLATQYSPLGGQAPEVHTFRCAVHYVLIGPCESVVCVGWVDDIESPVWTDGRKLHEVVFDIYEQTAYYIVYSYAGSIFRPDYLQLFTLN